MTHPHGYESTDQFSNEVAYVNLNAWRAPAAEAIYLELYPTKLFDEGRAAAAFSTSAARTLAAALNSLADIYEAHQAGCTE